MTEATAPGGQPNAAAPPAQPAGQSAASAPAPTAVPAAAPAAPAASPAEPQGEAKIKTRFPYQRACNEKDAKGKLCAGHLKRWYGFGEEIKRKYGENAEIYRCEYCHTLYLPAPGYESRSGTLQF
jgi:hypothetical protein